MFETATPAWIVASTGGLMGGEIVPVLQHRASLRNLVRQPPSPDRFALGLFGSARSTRTEDPFAGTDHDPAGTGLGLRSVSATSGVRRGGWTLLLSSWLLGCATAPNAVAPTELGTILLSPNEVRDVKVAPDGVHFFLWVRSPSGEDSLIVKRVRDRAVVGGFRFLPETNVYRVEWANEKRLVMEVGQDTIDALRPVFYGEIYAIDLDLSNPRLIFGFRAGKAFTTGTSIVPAEPIEAWGSILGPVPNSEDEILVASQRWPTFAIS